MEPTNTTTTRETYSTVSSEPTPPENTTVRTLIRILVAIIIIFILIFLSIGIVRVIPKIISSIFGGNATSTPSTMGTSTDTNNGNNNQGGVVIIDPEPTSSSTPNPGPKPPRPPVGTSGTPDLAVEIIGRGIINPATGAYIETDHFTSADTVVVRFKVENRGTAPTGIWNLSVSMPSQNPIEQFRMLNNNRSIPAGVSVMAKAVFNNPSVGVNLPITVSADPAGLLRDSNRNNNSELITISVVPW